MIVLAEFCSFFRDYKDNTADFIYSYCGFDKSSTNKSIKENCTESSERSRLECVLQCTVAGAIKGFSRIVLTLRSKSKFFLFVTCHACPSLLCIVLLIVKQQNEC